MGYNIITGRVYFITLVQNYSFKHLLNCSSLSQIVFTSSHPNDSHKISIIWPITEWWTMLCGFNGFTKQVTCNFEQLN